MKIDSFSYSKIIIDNLKKIAVTSHELNLLKLTDLVFLTMEHSALELSSFTSTSIEGNPLPLTEVKKILKNKPSHLRDTEKEVINYNDTLIWLQRQLQTSPNAFNMRLIYEIHRRCMQGLLPKMSLGKARNEPVFVNDPRKRKTIYWPPNHQDVTKLLTELLKFVRKNRYQMDCTLLAGLFHKAFVLIHPFIDGNGRSVRLATKFLLADMGLNTFPLFSFENFYNTNVTGYFAAVGGAGDFCELKDGLDYTPWLEYFTGGIIDELLRVQKELEKNNFHHLPKMAVHLEVVINYLEQNGQITDKEYAKITERAKATRALDFKKLLELKKITRLGKGKNTFYILQA